jgi:hypothetical protein
VISSTRSLSKLADLSSAATRRLALALVSSTTVLFALLLSAAPAGALVKSIPTGVGGTVTVGLQPRETASFLEGDLSTVASFNNPSGSPVLHRNETYAIYWDPTDHYHGDWQHLIDTFFQGLGADSGSTGTVFAVDSQYTDRSNLPASYLSTFHGAYTDTDSYPVGASNCKDPHPLESTDLIGPIVAGKHTEVCLTDAQIRKELETFIAAHDLQKGMGSIYYLLTPPGVTVCLDAGGPTGHCSDHTGSITETASESYRNSFCSYHSDISPTNEVIGDEHTILYGVIPWSAGGLGDYHLTGADEASAYDCQDGGWFLNPETHFVEKEHVKVTPQEEEAERLEAEAKKRAVAEAEETKKQTTYEEALEKKLITAPELKQKEAELKDEKEAREEKEEREEKKAAEVEREAQEKKAKLEGPHQEEPNQDGLGPDGSYDTGLADLIVSQIGVQQQDIVTDPLLNAWKDEVGNEVTDECRNDFLSYLGGAATANEFTFAGTLDNQSYVGTDAYINDAFNLAAGRLPYPGIPCMNSIDLVPQFTAPNPVNSGEVVGFDGMESDITLNDDIGYSATGVEEPKYASYKWNFGDGSPEVTGFAPGAPSLNSPETSPCELPWKAPCAASTFHSYQYGGTYKVTLTVTDTGGNTADVTREITVVGPPPPGATSVPGGASGTTGAPGQAAGASPSAASGAAIPGPVASERIASTSLRAVIKSGLLARYAVNEQVAGHFEVILNADLARKLGIHGKPAVGLTKGTPASVVIGEAILVTTQSARGTEKIKFDKHVLAGLRKASKVPLTLRLIIRNAASREPKTATVLTVGTLHR